MTYNNALDALRYTISPVDAEEQAAYLRLGTQFNTRVRFMLIQLDKRGEPTFADCATSMKDVRALAMWLNHRNYSSGRIVLSAVIRKCLLESDSWIVAGFYEIAKRIRSGL